MAKIKKKGRYFVGMLNRFFTWDGLIQVVLGVS